MKTKIVSDTLYYDDDFTTSFLGRNFIICFLLLSSVVNFFSSSISCPSVKILVVEILVC